jgi:hypothetical protein
LAKTHSEALNFEVVTDEFDANTFDENVDTEQHVEEDEETGNLQLLELLMQRSVHVVKAMRLMRPPHRLLFVMSRHHVALTGVHITQMKS